MDGRVGILKGGRVGILNGRMVGKDGRRIEGRVGNLKGAWVGEYTFTRTLGVSAGLLARTMVAKQRARATIEIEEAILVRLLERVV